MSQLVYPTQLRDHQGNEVRLPPKPFAIGGEGAIFDVLGRDDLVAKVYNKPQSRERSEKLRAMARLWNPDLLKIAAWPTATLSNGHGPTIEGILMPKIAGYREIHHLYSVAQRKKSFPEADWGFLLHTSRNCAVAFESVHGYGHVVGDVNQKNVMVSEKGLVAFVDCDSFQVADGSRIFRCEVGVPEYTPPELQGKGFATLDRAANHDLFGLAVLVFHLLMMGRHPFSGVPLTPADIPIEKAIREGYYAYTRNMAAARLSPPPHVPPMMILDPVILDLFERAFCTQRRPTATEWRSTLDAALKQLVRCKNDPKHAYLTAAGYCPWCELIAKARLMFFLPSRSKATAFTPEDIEQLIRKLDGMVLSFDPYVRPRMKSPVVALLPPGLQSLKKPVVLPYPPPPVQDPKPVLLPLPLPPAQLRMPSLRPIPPKPQSAGKPRFTPHPQPPPGPTLPKLNPLPPPPIYPEAPLLGPANPAPLFACLIGMAIGILVLVFAPMVGFTIFVGSTLSLGLLAATDNKRRGIAARAIDAAYEIECNRIDEQYEISCRPIKEANERRMAEWRAAKAVLDNEHARLCGIIDDKNARQLAEFEAAEAVIRVEHDQMCYDISAENGRVTAEWEAENSRRQLHYERMCKDIESKNRESIVAWESIVKARQSEHDRACRKIDEQNQRAIAAWKIANAPWFEEEQRWQGRLADAEGRRDRLEIELQSQRSSSQSIFGRRKMDVYEIVSSHDAARLEYRRDLQRAELDSKNIQLEEHLDKSLICDAKIKGISSRLVLALESFGIESARDVEMLKTQKVPGIGPVLCNRLFEWREIVQRAFVYQQTLPESERIRIANKYGPVFLPLGQTVQAAIRDLEAIASSHSARERELVKSIEAAVQDAAVAAAHLDALHRML